MSTPLSSTVPPRSSILTVPATQNTAPVIKFRCLYTHDMRRKAKRWQDGFLRYHTFNKRVMVFDINGYFIGDLHWRQDEGIQDGDELELDKGVLIQVCEPMERTETDLSSLYNNKNKSQVSPSRRGEPPASSIRSSAALRSSISSQQPPRSLNDLLGIKRTSTTQLLSPYEERQKQRQNAGSQQVSQRPTKRQRAASPDGASSPHESLSTIIDLLSSPPAEEITPAYIPTTSRVPGFQKDPPSRPPTVPSVLSAPSSRDSTGSQKPSNPPNSTTKIPPVPPNSLPNNSGTEATVNTLRLSASQPRRKLMYQPSVPRRTPTDALTGTTARPSQTQPQGVKGASHRTGVASGPSSDSTIIILDELDDDLMLDQPQPPGPIKNQEEAPPTDRPREISTGTINSIRANTRQSSATVNHQHPPSNDGISDPPQMQSKPAAPTNPPPPKQPILSLSSKNIGYTDKPPIKSRSLGLRKSYSDPSTINNIHTRPLSSYASPLNPSAAQSSVHGQGPWTPEALDLFDFWPPGRPKPS